VESARARALPVLLVVVAGVGIFARGPGEGRMPAACPQPAMRAGVLVCDGDGDDVGGRAWLVGRKLDVNAASADELERISGIGHGLATRIVDERSRRGRFARIEELDDVEGVGPKLLAKLGAFVEVR
jgi:competence protein ComEA